MSQIKLMIFMEDRNEQLGYRSFEFSGGELQVRLDANVSTPDKMLIDANLRSAHDIIELLLVTDAVRRRWTDIQIDLLCKYLPYARQDRVCAEGEAFSLQVMCSLINAQNYQSVTIWDVHSQKAIDLLNNVINIEAVDLIPSQLIGSSVLISPDKGAVPRVTACAERFNRPMFIADKIRNPDNGQITGMKVDGLIDTTEEDFLIIDDICDGGRTFIELAKILRPHTSGKIGLYVTHMISSQGFEVFHGLIDFIYTSNCFRATVPDFVHII